LNPIQNRKAMLGESELIGLCMRHKSHCETKYIRLNTRLCVACWACVESCSHDVIGRVNILFHRHARIDKTGECKGRLKCVKACQHKAITSISMRMAMMKSELKQTGSQVSPWSLVQIQSLPPNLINARHQSIYFGIES